MKDLVYYYDKKTFAKSELGEIQSGFSQSFVIDGTKDSAKIEVISYSKIELEAYTILYHQATDSWWIVSKDKVEKYINENGYVYKHNLTLDGAIELLNARDLTDCGFYQNRYTIGSFTNRLLSLSSFEFRGSTTIDTNNGRNIDLSANVDYIKTFENYTLLSALREFYDGYNCALKLSFTEDISGSLNGAIIKVVPKTGDTSYAPITTPTTYFNDVREITNTSKENNATTVVSNAENVISSITKTFPTTGNVRLTGTEATITPSNARLRLPSNIFKVNWLRLCIETSITMTISYGTPGQASYETHSYTINYKNGNDNYNNEQYEMMYDAIETDFSSNLVERIQAQLTKYRDELLFPMLELATRITLYNNDRYDPISKTFINPNEPKEYYAPVITKKYGAEPETYTGKLVLAPKTTRDVVLHKAGVIGWERGKDYIEDFSALSPTDALDHTNIRGYIDTDYRKNIATNYRTDTYENVKYKIQFANIAQRDLRISNTYFIVNYIPMTDLKVKYDNDNLGNDIHLYNQNGKLNDSNSVSKLILSHSKELENGTKTKYGAYYNLGYAIMPKVGMVVLEDNKEWVITNATYDYHQNENTDNTKVGYYVVAQFTLSPNVATKSILTSPNTNIRDYGIPQNYNVKRKHLYRDYYEFAHEYDELANVEKPYLKIDKVLNFTSNLGGYQEHVAVIKVVYDNAFGGDKSSVSASDTWYYQLNTTTYILKKEVYEVLDFKDNNIIGYGVLNVSSGFDPSKLITGLQALSNTPISYVDDNGQLKDLNIAFCTNEQITRIYSRYVEKLNSESISNASYLQYNSSAFIDPVIYNGWAYGQQAIYGAKNRNDFLLELENFNKDSIEVPVIEYSCQIGDSDDVVVGEDILKTTPSDTGYLFNCFLYQKGVINQNNANYYGPQSTSIQCNGDVETGDINVDVPNMNSYRLISDACKIEYSFTNIGSIPFMKLIIKQYSTMVVYNDNSVEYGTHIPFTSSLFDVRDLIIYRIPINNEMELSGTTSYADLIKHENQLFMIIKNLVNATINEDGDIEIKVNYYKTN